MILLFLLPNLYDSSQYFFNLITLHRTSNKISVEVIIASLLVAFFNCKGINTVIPRYPQGIGYRTHTDTKNPQIHKSHIKWLSIYIWTYSLTI